MSTEPDEIRPEQFSADERELDAAFTEATARWIAYDVEDPGDAFTHAVMSRIAALPHDAPMPARRLPEVSLTPRDWIFAGLAVAVLIGTASFWLPAGVLRDIAAHSSWAALLPGGGDGVQPRSLAGLYGQSFGIGGALTDWLRGLGTAGAGMAFGASTAVLAVAFLAALAGNIVLAGMYRRRTM